MLCKESFAFADDVLHESYELRDGLVSRLLFILLLFMDEAGVAADCLDDLLDNEHPI